MLSFPVGDPADRQIAIGPIIHTALAHQFARAFGNAQFEAPGPRELVC